MINYIIRDLSNRLDARDKSQRDIFTFALQIGFRKIFLPPYPLGHDFKAKLQKLKYSKITIPKLLKNTSDADVIVFQYPMYSAF